MNPLALSAILALCAIRSCSASAPIRARQVIIAVYVLTGYSDSGPPYPNYTVSVPENGVTIPISRSPSRPFEADHVSRTWKMNR